MPVDGMRVDWGASCLAEEPVTDVGALFGMGDDLGVASAGPSDADACEVQWATRAEEAVAGKISRDTLIMLAASPDAAASPAMRDKLLQRVADADAFGARAVNAMRQRPPLREFQALLAEGLTLGVETRELVQVQLLVRQALELQNRLAAFDYCEEQMDLRSLKSMLNEMERLPVVLQEEEEVRERWSQSNAWLDRAKTILSSPRRTRQGKLDAPGSNARQRWALEDVESLLEQGAALALVRNRGEARDLAQMVENFKSWRDEVNTELMAEPASGDTLPDSREERVQSMVERGADFPFECEESVGLVRRLWTYRAQTATRCRATLKDLADLTDKGQTLDAPAELLGLVEVKRAKAEEWVKKAQGALAKKLEVVECRALLKEADALEVDSEENFLIEYQIEAAESWDARVQAQLALSLEGSDYKVLKALLKESDRIAVRLDKIADVERRMEELELKEQEESECEWAQCDGCNKWRRLGKGQTVAESEKFFCAQVAKSCDDPEDKWDAEKEEITRYDGESDLSDADEDVSLADKKRMVPGALVYAQHAYYPFWPARIKDPDADYITAEILRARRHGSVLVQFLGRSMGTGLKWIDRRKLVPFTVDADPNDRPGTRPIRSHDYRTAVQSARRILKREQKTAQKLERKDKDADSGSSSRSGSSDNDQSDSSADEEVVEEEEYRERRRSSGGTKRPRNVSSAASQQRVREDKSSSKKQKKMDKPSGVKVNGVVLTVKDKKTRLDGQQAAGKQDAAAAASASAPLFPKWFTQLPMGWQGSYTNYTAVHDAEKKLKERLTSLSAQEDIRREVRNMVFCAFISALALEPPGGAASGSSANTGMSPSQAAQNLETALFSSCGSTITADYRRKYRVLAMALRSCPKVRAALMSLALTPSALIAMSSPALDTYGKSAPNAAKKPASAAVTSGGGAGAGAAGKAKNVCVVVKEEHRRIKEEHTPEVAKTTMQAMQPRVVKTAPSKLASFLPTAASKVEKSSRSPSPQAEPGADPVPQAPQRSPPPQKSPQSGKRRKQGDGAGHLSEGDSKAQRGEGVEPATVGEVCWVGAISKVESNTQVRVQAVSLDGARLRAVGRVPDTIKIVGRLPPENLAKFLAELSHSKSRHRTLVRFELEGGMRKAMDPSAVKAYNRLVEEYESKNRVGVINLPGQNEQLYVVGPSSARTVLRLDAPGHVLYGVFVMRVGHGGECWANVNAAAVAHPHPPPPPAAPGAIAKPAEGSSVSNAAAVVRAVGEVRPHVPHAAVIPLPVPGAEGEGASGNGGRQSDNADVLNAFESIKALLKATESSASAASDRGSWAGASAAGVGNSNGVGAVGQGTAGHAGQAARTFAPLQTVQTLPPTVSALPPPPHPTAFGIGMPAALPPPSTPHPAALPPPSHPMPPPAHARLLPGVPTGGGGGMPSHMPPPIVQPPGYGGPPAVADAPVTGPPPSIAWKEPSVPGVPDGSTPALMPPPPALMPPPSWAPGAFNDQNHAQNLQQLQNLSTESLISLLVSQQR